MTKTKEKILSSALLLFNRDGIVNVRLQHIADEAFVSIGNLAYHYPHKASIVAALYQKLTKEQSMLLAEYRVVPLFDNIHRLIIKTFELQQSFIFFYIDTLELIRAYPDIASIHRQHIRNQINQWSIILEFNQSRGALGPGDTRLNHLQLAQQIWMTMDLWQYQHRLMDSKPAVLSDYLQAIWNLIRPHFSQTGFLEFQQLKASYPSNDF